jgi:hypothetical protein
MIRRPSTNIAHDGTSMSTRKLHRWTAIAASSIVMTITLSACMSSNAIDPTKTRTSPGSVIDATAIEKQLSGIFGLASSRVGFKTTGFDRRAVINLYVTTDDPARLSQIQDFATRSIFTNSILPRPAEILEIFSWSPTLGSGAENHAPHAAIVAAIGSKTGVSISDMGPNTPVYATITSAKFDGGLSVVTPPTLPASLTTPPPLMTSPPTSKPTTTQ